MTLDGAEVPPRRWFVSVRVLAVIAGVVLSLGSGFTGVRLWNGQHGELLAIKHALQLIDDPGVGADLKTNTLQSLVPVIREFLRQRREEAAMPNAQVAAQELEQLQFVFHHPDQAQEIWLHLRQRLPIEAGMAIDGVLRLATQPGQEAVPLLLKGLMPETKVKPLPAAPVPSAQAASGVAVEDPAHRAR